MSKLIKGHHMAVLGRIGLDIYAEPQGARLEEAMTYKPVLGGSAGNIAAGLARLGNAVWMVSRLSDDAIGRRVRREMKAYNIHDDFVSLVGGDARTSLHLAENRMDNMQVVLYRNGAADFELSVDDIDRLDFSQFNALVVTGTALAREPSRGAVLEALRRAKLKSCIRIIDLDYRAPSWKSREEASDIYHEACKMCEIVVGNDEEFGVMTGELETGQALARELGQSRLVVYKMGAQGAVSFDHGHETQYGIFNTNALKPIGAGDSFMAAFLTKLADGKSLEEAMEYGAAHAAIVVAGEGCAPAMATRAEIDEFIQSQK